MLTFFCLFVCLFFVLTLNFSLITLSMDESLKEHINFLETQGIAGVSHHNLLFSKIERAVVVDEEEEVTRLDLKFASPHIYNGDYLSC